MAMLTTATALVGGMVRRIDLLAESEQHARSDLAAVNQELAEMNRDLETRVQDQVGELERLNRLRRFLSPQVAEVVMSAGSDDALAPHRRDIAVFFCDLRGFTRFTSQAEPEEVLDVINAYYAVIGRLLRSHNGTVGDFAGDGIMAYFNDPVPCETPALAAVRMALAVRAEMAELVADWNNRGYDLGYGIGISYGYATLGIIGFEGRHDYSPLGSVVNLGARLCSQAGSEQILVDQRVHAVISPTCETKPVGKVTLKGFADPITISEVVGTATGPTTTN
jgi:class 3 adenylate cyclase